MPCCLIGLGSNLGNRRDILQESLAKLRGHPRIEVLAVSSLRQTSPIGGPAGQGDFLNAAALLECSLQPGELLKVLQQIETEAGRIREETWGPRTLDIDMLLYDEALLSTPDLQLPHPRMAWRRFVLEPAAEVAGRMIHPVIGWSVERLLEHLNTALPYVAIAGPIAVGKTHLARLLSEKTSAGLISERIDEKSLEIFYANPAGNAWAAELEFLRQRTELLSCAKPVWSRRGPGAISDFWFDQSPAFARVWLAESQLPEFIGQWEQSRRQVVPPKLLVLLDAPGEVLLDRIGRRARPGEQHLNLTQIERIRQSILDQASRPGLGLVLKLSGIDIESALNEVVAAIQAME